MPKVGQKIKKKFVKKKAVKKKPSKKYSRVGKSKKVKGANYVCIACGGSGRSSAGFHCIACGGFGRVKNNG